MALRPKRIEPHDALAGLFDQARTGLAGSQIGWLSTLRQENFKRFMALGWPTQRVEAWKYTNLTELAAAPLTLAQRAEVSEAELAPFLVPLAYRLVFINGHFAAGLSDLARIEGATVTNLADALESQAERLAFHFTDQGSERALDCLNVALCTGGAYIHVEASRTPPVPLQLLFVTTGDQADGLASPRNIIQLDDAAQLTLIETHVRLDERAPVTNLVNHVNLGVQARLKHDRVQLGAANGTFIGRMHLRAAAESHYDQTLACFSGALTRNETLAEIDGGQAHVGLNGMVFARGRQMVDNVIKVDHKAAHCTSDQHYKAVLTDRATNNFAGKIHVYPDAQKTNAYQSNNNLLLSPDVQVNTKPELEIYADDVKCSHGATAGELEDSELFYLRSRGIDLVTARSLMTYAFVGDVLERFADDNTRLMARNALLDHLPGGESLKEMA